MRLIAAATIFISLLVSGLAYATDDELEANFPKITRPAGTVYCNFNAGGVDGEGFIRSVPRNDLINLRQGPGTNYAILSNFEGGAGYVVARYQNWFELRGYRDSPYTMGWFHGKYINVSRMRGSDKACLRIPRNFNPN